jgi:hypothetical protein
MHNFHMGEVTVRKDHLLNSLALDNVRKVFLRKDRNSFGIQRPRQLRRKKPVFDSGNLSSCEGHHLHSSMIAVIDLKIMKIPSRCPHNDNSGSLHLISCGYDLI